MKDARHLQVILMVSSSHGRAFLSLLDGKTHTALSDRDTATSVEMK